MKVFLIILAVLFALTVIILSLSAELTLIYDEGWVTRVRVLFIEKDIQLSKILSFILFPDKAGKQAAENVKEKKAEEVADAEQVTEDSKKDENPDEVKEEQPQQKKKPNPIQSIIDKDGILGILLLVSNLLQTAGTAVSTLIKGLHIYSLYVKMIIGGGDAAEIGMKYGKICGVYYPIKGMILSGMRVDQYDDYIQADFIAPMSEYGFQFIGSINVGLLVKVLLKAAKVFVINFIKNR